MNSKLNPYINFNGNTKEVMEFYKNALGGELTMSTYGQMAHNPSEADKIMHASLITPAGLTIMAADTPEGWAYNPGTNISVSLSGEDDAELQGYWDKLTEGGKVEQPLVPAPWGDKFGMFTDKFGIHWMVNITAKKA
jgi:PhnB protein